MHKNVDLAETQINIEIFEMEENNDEREIDLDVDAIQHIAQQFQKQNDNTDNNNNEGDRDGELHNISIQLSHHDCLIGIIGLKKYVKEIYTYKRRNFFNLSILLFFA